MSLVDNPSTQAPQVFPGHIGHLSPAQEDVLSAFKANLAEAKLYTFSSDLRKASHDESTLLYVIPSLTGAAYLTHVLYD
jgi:hypothetical protein